MFKRKKKESAIPAFWLDDNPAPPELMRHASVQQRPPAALQQQNRHAASRVRPDQLRTRPVAPQYGGSGGRLAASARPVRPHARQQAATPLSPQAPPAQHSPTQPQPTISIQVQMPHFKLPQLPRPSARQFRYGVIALGCMVVLGVGGVVAQRLASRHTKKATLGQSTQQAKPSFKPLVPVDDNKQSTPTHYDAEHKVLSFTDTYAGASLTVSEQELPEKFKGNEAAFKEMAKSFGAEKNIDVGIGTLYVAGYEQNQFGILRTEKFLLFLRSNKQLPTEAWKDYLATLRLTE